MEFRIDLLSIELNRLVSLENFSSNILSEQELQKYIQPEDSFRQELLGPLLREKWKLVPKNLSQIYLGETYCFHLFVINDSVFEIVRDITLKIDLQISNEKVTTIGTRNWDSLDAKQSVEDILRYEVKHLGNHKLICTVSYKTSSEDKQVFRKHANFEVNKPLDVRTKFYNAENDEVYLEALLQNQTIMPMRLEKVALEPSEYFDVKEMNKIQIDGQEQWVFGKVNIFNQDESRQYLFCLTPKPKYQNNLKVLRSVTIVGKLDIVWVSGLGINGHLQTSPLERRITQNDDISMTIISIPSQVKLKSRFNITFRISNNCENDIEPILYFKNVDEKQSILWLGVSGQSLGRLKPLEHVDFSMMAYPIEIGLQPIPRIQMSDNISKKLYDLEEVSTYIFILWLFISQAKEKNLRKQISKLKEKQITINVTQEFAKHAKIERKISKMSEELNQARISRMVFKIKAQFISNVILYILTSILSIYLIWKFSSTPLIIIPSNILFPINYILSYPTGIDGAVSITSWLALVSYTMKSIFSMSNKLIPKN